MMHEGNHFRENGDDVWLEFRNFPDWLVIDEKTIAQTLALCGVEYLDVRANDQFRDHDRLCDIYRKGTRHTLGVRSRSRKGFDLVVYLRNLGIDSSVLPESQEEEAAAAERVNTAIKTALLAFANEQLVTLSRKFPFFLVDMATFSFEVIYLVLMLVTLVNMISELTAGVPIVPRMENTSMKEITTDYFQYVLVVWALSTAVQVRELLLHNQEDDQLSTKVKPPRLLPNFPLDRYLQALMQIVQKDYVVDLDTAMPDPDEDPNLN